MQTTAIVLSEPKQIDVRTLGLLVSDADVVVAVEWSAISTGTERLLYDGTMPTFPGMGYPLVPGYEAVGRVVGRGVRRPCPSAMRCSCPAPIATRARAGCSAPPPRISPCPAARLLPIPAATGRECHAAGARRHRPPRLLRSARRHPRPHRRPRRAGPAARPPRDRDGRPGADGVGTRSRADGRRRRLPGASIPTTIRAATIAPSSTSAAIRRSSTRWSQRLAPGGEIVLAGFYKRCDCPFAFPPAFMREARFRVAAQWQRDDLETVGGLARDGRLVAGRPRHPPRRRSATRPRPMRRPSATRPA